MNRAINGVMFVMISAILLAWAPTAAYAGDPGPGPVTIITEDRKGVQDGGTCTTNPDNYKINIRGKGEYTLDGGTPVPIPSGTGQVRVLFDVDTNSIITTIKFIKNSGFVAAPNDPNPGASSILIDAKIANKKLCNLDIPKGTTSLTLTGVFVPG